MVKVFQSFAAEPTAVSDGSVSAIWASPLAAHRFAVSVADAEPSTEVYSSRAVSRWPFNASRSAFRMTKPPSR